MIRAELRPTPAFVLLLAGLALEGRGVSRSRLACV